MALNTLKFNHLMPLCFKGLTSHSIRNKTFHRQVFRGNNYAGGDNKTHNNQEKVHKSLKKLTNIKWPLLRQNIQKWTYKPKTKLTDIISPVLTAHMSVFMTPVNPLR